MRTSAGVRIRGDLFAPPPRRACRQRADTEQDDRFRLRHGRRLAAPPPGQQKAELDVVIAVIALATLAGAAAFVFFAGQARRTIRRIDGARTALAASHAALRLSEGYLKAVLDDAADGIVATDSAGAIRSANRAAERMFDYAPGRLAGEPISRILPELGLPLAETPAEARPRTTGLRRDGARLRVELAVNALRHGAESGFVAVLVDATERRGAVETLDLLPAAVLIAAAVRVSRVGQRAPSPAGH
jgi:PAS domain S-box-containing protein